MIMLKTNIITPKTAMFGQLGCYRCYNKMGKMVQLQQVTLNQHRKIIMQLKSRSAPN